MTSTSLTFSRKKVAIPAPQDPRQLQASKAKRLVRDIVKIIIK